MHRAMSRRGRCTGSGYRGAGCGAHGHAACPAHRWSRFVWAAAGSLPPIYPPTVTLQAFRNARSAREGSISVPMSPLSTQRRRNCALSMPALALCCGTRRPSTGTAHATSSELRGHAHAHGPSPSAQRPQTPHMHAQHLQFPVPHTASMPPRGMPNAEKVSYTRHTAALRSPVWGEGCRGTSEERVEKGADTVTAAYVAHHPFCA